MEENMINESDINTISLYEELKSKIEKEGSVDVTISEFDVDLMMDIKTTYTFNKVEFIENEYYIIGYFENGHFGFTSDDL